MQQMKTCKIREIDCKMVLNEEEAKELEKFHIQQVPYDKNMNTIHVAKPKPVVEVVEEIKVEFTDFLILDKGRRLIIYADGKTLMFGYGGLRTEYKTRQDAWKAATKKQAELRAVKYGWNEFKKMKQLDEALKTMENI